ncbi:MAG: hypothetical protein WCC90_17175 [Methylocella sp.]|jgi:hypothetical protein
MDGETLFIGDEDEALGVELSLRLLPPRPAAGDVRALLFAWPDSFQLHHVNTNVNVHVSPG